MTPATSTDQREPKDSRPDRTPSADVQPDDAGTPASGNTGEAGRGAAAQPALKQTAKTGQETGSRG